MCSAFDDPSYDPNAGVWVPKTMIGSNPPPEDEYPRKWAVPPKRSIWDDPQAQAGCTFLIILFVIAYAIGMVVGWLIWGLA